MSYFNTIKTPPNPDQIEREHKATLFYFITEIEPTAAITMSVSAFHERCSFSPLLPQPNHNCPPTQPSISKAQLKSS